LKREAEAEAAMVAEVEGAEEVYEVAVRGMTAIKIKLFYPLVATPSERKA